MSREHLTALGGAANLLKVRGGGATGDAAYATHQGGAFGGGDYTAGVEHVEEVRTLQAVVVGGENRKAGEFLPFRVFESFE